MKGKTVMIMLKVPYSSHRKLKEIAANECRTLASVVRQALQEHFSEDQLQKAKDAVAKLDGHDFDELAKHFKFK